MCRLYRGSRGVEKEMELQFREIKMEIALHRDREGLGATTESQMEKEKTH